jgi:predicted dehydrogenase
MRYWQWCVRHDRLGSILFAEGHYLHAVAQERFWRHGRTGELLTWTQAQTTAERVKTRMWSMTHPILYGPHELSPLLKVLDDRVVSVSCYSTGAPSKRFREVPFPGQFEEVGIPDLEVALMQTAKGAIVRFAAGFQVPVSQHHWYHILGTKGELETGRGLDEPGHSYSMPLPVIETRTHNVPRAAEPWFGGAVPPPSDVAAILAESLSAEARRTGHGGYDFYPLANFVRALLGREKPDIDVYQAVETAVPVILAAQSADLGGQRLDVPDLRPANN